MWKKIINNWPILFLLTVILAFFSPFFLQGKIPISADTIVGMYHPFRDKIWDNFTAGVPFKNFLITDAVRQQYPWRLLSIDLLKNWQFPLWNPFSFSGTSLLANLQSAVFYPLNILFWLLPFNLAWGAMVFLQLLLAGVFFYALMRLYNLDKKACLLGSLSFIFCGFFVAWLEWNTILQVALWLPLILLAKENIIRIIQARVKNLDGLFDKKIFLWSMVLIFSESASFLAGHIQTFSYVLLVATLYLIIRLYQLQSVILGSPKGDSRIRFWIHPENSSRGTSQNDVKKGIGSIKYHLLLFGSIGLIIFLLISPQLLPFIEFVLSSARSFDQPLGFRTDWYLPWQHLVQFIAPDFFGNPTTLNYWGQWNYGEFVGYIGIIPLIFALIAVLGRRDKKTLFFAFLVIVSLLFALPNVISFLPYKLHLPFISTTAPSRLIFVTDFSLAVLAALGLDLLTKERKIKTIFISGIIIGMLLGIIWLVVLVNPFKIEIANLLVAKRNLYLPTGLFILGWIIIFFLNRHSGKSRSAGRIQNRFWASQNDVISSILVLILLLLTSYDLLRFSQKFNPFVKKDWIFPQTETIKFLQNQPQPFRIESLDDRIMPPNFASAYGLETIEGYDPLIDKRYAEFMAAVLRNKPDITSFNFNRIITPKLSDNPFINLLNVKYFLSLSDLKSSSLAKVFQEGQTRVYENLKVQPRVFLVNNLVKVNNKQEAINQMFVHKDELDKIAVVEQDINLPTVTKNSFNGASLTSYSSQKIVARINTANPSFLVLSQSFLPGWKAKIDGIKIPIYHTDYVLGGVVVPAGKHSITFYYQPFTFLIGLANFGLGVIMILIWGIKVWLKKRSA